MDLSTILLAGSCLVDSTAPNSAPHLKAVLLSRLAEYNKHLGRIERLQQSTTLDEAQLQTAEEALYVVEQVQNILAAGRDDTSVTEEAPAIGTRDLAHLRTLLQIIFKWGIDLLLPRVAAAWPSKPTSSDVIGVIDISSISGDYNRLSTLTSRLIRLVLPSDAQTALPLTLLTTVILNRHLPDLLNPCISLGWLPKSLASESMPTLDDVRPLVTRFLSILSPSQTISALGSILSNKRPLPQHAHRSCASLLTQELLRPDGIRGLCDAIFGDGGTDDAPLEKLEHVSRVLSTVPAAMKAEEYFDTTTPRVVALLSGVAPPSHKRAAAFALSRMLASPGFRHQTLVSMTVLPILHKSFSKIPLERPDSSQQKGHNVPGSIVSSTVYFLPPRRAISTLTTILTNTDPSPVLISTLLSPILPPLYAILFYLDGVKTSDPQLKESLKSLLTTWGRVVSLQEVVSVLWTILDDQGGGWETDGEGEIRPVLNQSSPPLSLLTPEDFRRAAGAKDHGFDLNILNLRPDPVHFVQFVKSFERSDIYSEMFVKLLESYRNTRSRSTADPLRTMLYLQLILQMQTQLSDGNSPSSILRQPEHVFSFVKHVLASVVTALPDPKPPVQRRAGNVLRKEDLRIRPEDDQPPDDDSDDEGNDISDADITVTAINLLLSILEANAHLSARTTPVLNDIFDLLESVANEASHPARLVAREARMVITARMASTSVSQMVLPNNESSQEMYQKALKLLQDPILPVRAHGLLLLRQIITSTKDSDADRSLVPAILSIFLQYIEDDDSYMFLNAVQGLAVMVDKFGKDVLKGLVDVYSRGLNGSGAAALTQHEVDVRIRVGEALGQVIRRCGEALGSYVHLLVPPLFHIVRSSSVSTTLRSSALSLLAECENTNSLSLLHYSGDLFEGMIDLLQVETVGAHRDKTSSEKSKPTDAISADTEATSTSSKLPPLRRAALHFLLRLIQQTTIRIHHSGSRELTFPMKRAHTTVGYVASTDEDAIVRVMARETLEALNDLARAILGV